MLMSISPNRSYRWLFWSLALLGLLVDQASKYGVFAGLYNDGHGGSWELVPGVFSLDAKFSGVRDSGDHLFSPLRTIGGEVLPTVNHGALWGIGGRNQFSEPGSDFNNIFAIVSVLAAAAIIVWSMRSTTAQDRFLSMALGLILAGTVGNLFDHVVFSGVRDFLHWKYLFDFPVFNLADSCLVCGAGLLLVQAFFTEPEKTPATVAAVEAAHLPASAEVNQVAG